MNGISRISAKTVPMASIVLMIAKNASSTFIFLKEPLLNGNMIVNG